MYDRPRGDLQERRPTTRNATGLRGGVPRRETHRPARPSAATSPDLLFGLVAAAIGPIGWYGRRRRRRNGTHEWCEPGAGVELAKVPVHEDYGDEHGFSSPSQCKNSTSLYWPDGAVRGDAAPRPHLYVLSMAQPLPVQPGYYSVGGDDGTENRREDSARARRGGRETPRLPGGAVRRAQGSIVRSATAIVRQATTAAGRHDRRCAPVVGQNIYVLGGASEPRAHLGGYYTPIA